MRRDLYFFLKSYQEVPSLAGNDMGGILSMTLVGTAAMTHRPRATRPEASRISLTPSLLRDATQ